MKPDHLESNDLSVRERIQRSRIGPALRSSVSHLQTPLWRARGSRPPALPHIKRAIITDAARSTGSSIFVETGTFRGDTVAHMASVVPRVISIELDDAFYELAVDRFASRPNVELLHGDSTSLLPGVVVELDEPALFWLDGHYSGGVTARGDVSTPIMQELDAVLSSPLPHSILVDDARLFDGTGGYPSLAELRAFCVARVPSVKWAVGDDIIRLMPPRT